ncbi:MAG: phosphate signaling complex protein PhoU [Desulfobulbaceae bacterium]|nr:phosphate signaling complex protein PhoU [Desulfobulbaceae bacterium]
MHHNYQKQIEKLREKFLTLGSIVEDRVRKACSAFNGDSLEDIEMVIKSDYEIDEMEVEIEEECLKILALYQPVASDLRFIIALIKINSEMERIGDYAVKIAMRVKFISEHSTLLFPMDYTPMAEKVITMLKMSLDALVDKDADLAHRIFILDDEVDAMRNKAYDIIKKQLRKQPEHAGCLLNGYLLARHLERIADRATNIAEEIIYMVHGDIVRGEHN